MFCYSSLKPVLLFDKDAGKCSLEVDLVADSCCCRAPAGIHWNRGSDGRGLEPHCRSAHSLRFCRDSRMMSSPLYEEIINTNRPIINKYCHTYILSRSIWRGTVMRGYFLMSNCRKSWCLQIAIFHKMLMMQYSAILDNSTVPWLPLCLKV